VILNQVKRYSYYQNIFTVIKEKHFIQGTMSPWIDESAADARWNIEDFGTPFDPLQPAPPPPSGTKYLRVNRPSGFSGLFF
jgi:hypothetical protein